MALEGLSVSIRLAISIPIYSGPNALFASRLHFSGEQPLSRRVVSTSRFDQLSIMTYGFAFRARFDSSGSLSL
jgi:hypothetical protein